MALALALLASLALFSLGGCGSTNHNSDYDPDSGRHPAGWLPGGHAIAAAQRLDTCTPCHGTDFNGGISKVSCNLCHMGGVSSVHPAEWDAHGPFAYALHGGFVRQHGAAGCSNIYCHGANLEGVPGSGPSCTGCHLGGPFEYHPVEWKNQMTLHGGYVLQHGTSGPPNQGCRNAACHGPQLEGVFLSGPGCNACHNFTTPIANIPGPLSPAELTQVRAKYEAQKKQ